MKDRSTKVFIGIIVIIISVFALIIAFQPKKVDWTPTFLEKKKTPYGDYVLFQFLPDIFPNQEIYVEDRTLYEELDYFSFDHENTEKKGTYMIITNSLQFGLTDWEALTKYVQKGNDVFIAASSFPHHMTDSLKFKLLDSYYDKEFTMEDVKNNTTSNLSLNFVNSHLKRENNFFFKAKSIQKYFSEIDSTHTKILGINSENNPTYIKIKFGEGSFYLSSTPLVFTNYNMLYRGNEGYIERAFSYLPQTTLYWDDYYKPFKQDNRGELSFVMNQEPLMWAWYITIWTAILYLIFNMKRIQRIIPIITPPVNSTLEFVQTISKLYYQRGNHKDIAKKKVFFFYEYIRSYYYLNPNHQDDIFFRKLSHKTGKKEQKLRKLFDYLEVVTKTGDFSAQELTTLNKKLNDFKNGRK